ncbi:hypothetical protein ACJQWK_10067 [Exserohilum turcicum]
MHWSHIKWRPPWRKRHLSVLEKFLADDAATRKAYEKERQRVSTARRNTLARLENRESSWQQFKRLLRHLRGYTVGGDALGDFGDESMMVAAKNYYINFEAGDNYYINFEAGDNYHFNFEAAEPDAAWPDAAWPDVWEGDYEDVLDEYSYALSESDYSEYTCSF